MPMIAYETKNFQAKALETIERAATICRDYQRQGYNLTLRQLYYQFVSKAWIENTERSYKNLGRVVNDGRLAGLLDWNWINDRTRGAIGGNHWETPLDLMRAAAEGFHLDYWEHQDIHIEVWVEKEALADVVQQVASRFDLTSLACRGYLSQSESWRSARRLRAKIGAGKRVLVLHLGDHDPSGIDMSRDNAERLVNFIAHDLSEASGVNILPNDLTRGFPHHDEDEREQVSYRLGIDLDDRPLFEFRRIALTMDQVEQYSPPPNPAKQTDSRFADYESIYGDESWELDALPPNVLDALIAQHIQEEMDAGAFNDAVERERVLIERATDMMDRHGHELED